MTKDTHNRTGSNWNLVLRNNSQNWKRSLFIPIPKKGSEKECTKYYTIALISHASKGMLKIL